MSANFVHYVLDMENLFLEEEEKGKILRKSSNISKQARAAGNQLYTRKNHDKNIHRNILLQYSKSIAFAPKDSEELALGYSNRSVLLMHLHYYEKCMFDIQKALEITKCDQLKSKLESRKQKCMMLMNEQKDGKDSSKINKINMVPSKKIPSAAECVSLKYNKTYGRHLIANRDIQAGEIVVAEKGYACYPKYDQMYLVCSHCLAFAWNGIPCNFCAFTIYCNESCKNEAWEEYHSVECPLLKFLLFDENIHTGDVILANRMFIKAVKAEGFDNVMNETQIVHDAEVLSRLLSDGVLNSNKFRSCFNLQCRYPDYRQNTHDYMYECMIIYLLIKKTSIIESQERIYDVNDEKFLIQLKNIFIKLRDIIDMCGFFFHGFKCKCTSVDMCGLKCDSVRGTLVVPCSSLMNHSCLPNVGKFYMQPRKLGFFASRPIKYQAI